MWEFSVIHFTETHYVLFNAIVYINSIFRLILFKDLGEKYISAYFI